MVTSSTARPRRRAGRGPVGDDGPYDATLLPKAPSVCKVPGARERAVVDPAAARGADEPHRPSTARPTRTTIGPDPPA